MTRGWLWAGLFCGKASSRTAVFRKEIESNLERVYVMEQRRIISRKLDLTAPVPCGFEGYAQCVQDFNTAFDEHRDCKALYDSSLDQQDHAHAVVLDRKYEAMTEKFNLLKPGIIAALQPPVPTEAGD